MAVYKAVIIKFIRSFLSIVSMKKATIVAIVLCGLMLGACSSKGVRMPKHRKRTHCDCPTFSMNETTEQPQSVYVL